MLEKIYQEIGKEISGERIKKTATKLWQIDRWFTFPKFHQSAKLSKEEMKKVGLNNVELLRYNADGKTRYADYIIPQAWDAKDAELKVIEPKNSSKLLASYKKIPQSLFMYSAPTPKEGIISEVILLKDGSKEKDYQGKNIEGKIVLTSKNPQSIWRLAKRDGAIGIIYANFNQDGVHWENYCFVPRNDKNMFGFSISGEDGRYLMNLLKKNKKVKVLAKVNTKLYNDKAETVTGIIPGKNKKEEILVFAHLYEIGTWDNASGAASVLEIARVLNNLIKKRVLPQPKRSIRFMLGWECYSLIGYLTRDKRSEPIAGLTMDALGLDPLKYDAPIGIHCTPDSNPSYVDILLEEIAKSYLTPKRHLPVWKLFSFAGGDSLPSDPFFNIPMPYLYQPCHTIWHTSIDTSEKLLPESLKWSAVVGATYLYFLANSGYKEASWLAEKVCEKYQKKLVSVKAPDKSGNYKFSCSRSIHRAKHYQRDRGMQALNSTRKLLTDKEKKKIKPTLSILTKDINSQTTVLRKEPKIKKSKKLTSLEKKASKMIPKRLIPGILTLQTLPEEMKDSCKWGPGYQVLVKPILWTDGKRNILEIAELLHLETNREIDLKDLVDCYEFLEKYGYVKIKRS